ncbi:MAG TPA: type II/IV secretion system protein [Gammaproteobacteria bacterium]|nr:type II/IV secretion system protein [Gammaproteobacteria bacterium]
MDKDNQHDHPIELGEIIKALFSDGLIKSTDLDRLILKTRSQERFKFHPLVVIANQNLQCAKPPHKQLTLETLTVWLAKWSNLPYERIDPLKIDAASATSVMSYAYAERNKVLPLAVNKEEVIIATAEPYVTHWQHEIAHILNKKITRVIANPIDISRYLVEFYSVSKSVLGATNDSKKTTPNEITNLEQMLELGKKGQLDANDQHVISIVDWLLQFAFEQRASDIHIEPRREQGNIRFRIDGVLHLVYQMPTPVMAAVVSRIKILGRMDLAEKRRPLDGRLKTKNQDGSEIELRLATLPTAFGEKLVMRIFDPEILVKNFNDLGLIDDDLDSWESIIKQPNGIILVTGPTGSGKTTTLYSTLKHISSPDLNICTVEDPIEMVEPEFNQMQVQSNIDLNFSDGIRALLRQDPDIIMVGEIRDQETAEMAIQAALTGHLVLSTLHTNDATSTLTRLLDIGIQPYLISSTLLGILAQRLIRTLCPHCKTEAPLDQELWGTLRQQWDIATPETTSIANGCLECRNTGYSGRIGIYEILPMTPALRKLIQSHCDIEKIRHQALLDGMQPLRISGLKKVLAGQSTLEEVFRVSPPFKSE